MKILEDMSKCCGCGACFNRCPVNAINMLMNEEGFLEPKVDSKVCIKCGACIQVCPTKSKVQDNWDRPRIYAVAAEEKLLSISSSGGVFTLLAEQFLNNGGVVVGAAYTSAFDVNHILIESVEQLGSLRLSKYVQSDQKDCYVKTKRMLDEGRAVLYSGCPCQIAGLKSFLGKEKKYDNLYTVDLICHGVPSPLIFKDYLESTWGIENIASMRMRKYDGWGTCFYIKLKNGNSEWHSSAYNVFMKGFLKDLFSRRSCYNCAFSYLPRYGDITIGDMWNAKKLKLGLPYEEKSSLVLINNEHGLNLWNEVLTDSKHEICCDDLSESVDVKKLNKNVYEPIVTDKDLVKRETFYNNYKTMPFEEAALKTLHPYNVGLVLYMSDNYGSCATNFALYKTIENLGFSPLILDNLVAPEGLSARFAKAYLKVSSGFLETDDYKAANYICDAFIVGSDQSLRWDFPIVLKNLEYLLMDFAKNDKKKIGYAVSLGPERYSMDKTMQDLYTYSLSRFTRLSVREDYAVDMCNKNFSVHADWVPDPVFLIGQEDYLEIANKSKLEFNEEYVLVYILHSTNEKKQLIEKVREQLNLKIIVITDADRHDALKMQLGMVDIIDRVEFVDWLAYFANASYIITDSFHGTCVSLIFEKQYISLKAGTTERFDSLANMLDSGGDLERIQIYGNVKSLLEEKEVFKNLDYDEIRKRIFAKREEGLAWLKSALNNDEVSPEVGDEILVEYARLVKEKFDNYILKQYGYEEQIKEKSKTLAKEGKSFLEIQRILNNEIQFPADPITKINDVENYFNTLSKENKYTILICAKDDCAVFFSQFVEKSNLPLKKRPQIHNSYIAIISRNNNIFEQVSSEPLQKSFLLNPASQLNETYCMDESTLNEISETNPYPMFVNMVSVKWNRKLQNQKSIISINNIDYSLNRRGVNIVVINENLNRVVDSFRIDLHADAQLSIKRNQ